MKKKILAIAMALAAVCALGLAGCGGGSNGSFTHYDTGAFTVDIPEGWKAFPVVDVFSEDKSANPDALQIGLGAESEADLFKVPYIYINHAGPETTLLTTSSLYDNVVELDPITIGDRTWEAFTGDSLGYGLTVLSTGEDNEDQFQVTLSQGAGEGNVLPDVNDPAIQGMIASISLETATSK